MSATNGSDRMLMMRRRAEEIRADPNYVPPPPSTPLSRFQDRPTLKRAVSLFCCHCMGYELDGSDKVPKLDVMNCTAKNCPLYSFRPYKNKVAQ